MLNLLPLYPSPKGEGFTDLLAGTLKGRCTLLAHRHFLVSCPEFSMNQMSMAVSNGKTP